MHGHTYSKSMNQPGKVAKSCSWSAEQGKLPFPRPRSRLKIQSREMGSAVLPRVSLLISIILRLPNSSRVPRRRPFIYLNHRTLAGQSRVYRITHRWRLIMPRVRRHRASTPQGSSERVLPWQITIAQIICLCVCIIVSFVLDVSFVDVPVGITLEENLSFPSLTLKSSLLSCVLRFNNSPLLVEDFLI